MNRLRTIFLEDIGIGFIGALPLVDRLLGVAERARDAYFRGFDHEENLRIYRLSVFRLVGLMSDAPRKTRFLSHVLCVLAKTSSDWVAKNDMDLSDVLVGSLEEELKMKSILAIRRVFPYYRRVKKTDKFPGKAASAVFDACRKVAPGWKSHLDILQKWFRRGYSENELAVYSAVLVAIFRNRRQFFSATVSECGDHGVIEVFDRLARGSEAPKPMDEAYDQHTQLGKKRKRGGIHFAAVSSVVIPEMEIPMPYASLFKEAYLKFKEATDSSALPEHRALIRRCINDIRIPKWPVSWSGQVWPTEIPSSDWFTSTARAQKGNKKAKTHLGTVKGLPGTFFFKGPFEDPIPWETQAYVDSIKPLFGLHPIKMLRVLGNANGRSLLMRDLNEGQWEADEEGIVKPLSARAMRANQVLQTTGNVPNPEGMVKILLFRAVWGISDSNGNNILWRKDQQKW